jgi:hypothetical protein
MRDVLDEGAAADTGEDNHATALECPPVSFAIVFEHPKTMGLTKSSTWQKCQEHTLTRAWRKINFYELIRHFTG